MIKLTCEICKKQFEARRKDMRACLDPKCRKGLHALQQRDRTKKAKSGETARSGEEHVRLGFRSSSASPIPEANDLIARLNAILEKLSAWADERAAIGALIQACHDKIEKGRYDAQSLKMRLRAIYIGVPARARIVETDRLPADDDLPEEPSAIVGAKPEKP